MSSSRVNESHSKLNRVLLQRLHREIERIYATTQLKGSSTTSSPSGGSTSVPGEVIVIEDDEDDYDDTTVTHGSLASMKLTPPALGEIKQPHISTTKHNLNAKRIANKKVIPKHNNLPKKSTSSKWVYLYYYVLILDSAYIILLIFKLSIHLKTEYTSWQSF
jgi:hypothetical protein